MTDFLRSVSRGPSTYLDSADATTDHSRAKVAPMLKDQTILLAGLSLGSPPIGANCDGDLVLQAATDFDGTVTLKALPILAPWVPTIGYDDQPDLWMDTAATWTGTLSAGDLVTFNWDSFGSTYGDGMLPAYGAAVWRDDTGTEGSLYTLNVGDERAPAFIGDFFSSPTTPDVHTPHTNKIVGAQKPVLSGSQPSEPMVSQQWQVGNSSAYDEDTGLTTPTWDSLEVASTVLQIDTSTTTVPFSGFPPSGTTRYLTCRYKSADGTWSKWAVPESCGGYLPLPVPVVTSPASGYAPDPVPTYAWTPDGTQTKYRVLTYRVGTADPIDDSSEKSGTATTYTPVPPAPKGVAVDQGVLLLGSEAASVTVRQWDDVDRCATPGLQVYGESSQGFSFSDNETVPTPDLVAVFQIGSSPWVQFQMTVSPDIVPLINYVIFTWGADTNTDIHIARRKLINLEGPTEIEGSLLYTWTYWDAQPWQDGYVGGIKLVTGAGTSPAVYGALDSLEVQGMWFGDADPESSNYGLIAWHSGTGTEPSISDQYGVLQGLGQQFPSIQWNTISYTVFDCKGVIRDFDDIAASTWSRRLRGLAKAGRVVRGAWENVSMPGIIVDHPIPMGLADTGSPVIKAVEHKFIQLDLASFATLPFGSATQTYVDYDFEVDIEGDATVDGDPILKESVANGSPGVTDKDASPVYDEGAALLGTIGANVGAH